MTAFKKLLFPALALFPGWIAAFAMPPASQWAALFIGIGGLYWLYTKTENACAAFLTGFFFALGYFVTGLWWIGNALLVDGNEFAWVWPISVIGLPTLLALFTGTYLAIARMLAAPHTFTGLLLFAFFLTFSEWTRGSAFTGFPWNLYGYVWSDYLAMAQIAHYTGAFGLTLLSVFWAATPSFVYAGEMKRKAKIFVSIGVILSIAATYTYGAHRLTNNPTGFDETAKLVVVQPNIAQDMKWDPQALQDNFAKIISLSKAGRAETKNAAQTIIIWPETAISPSVYTVPSNMDAVKKMIAEYEGANTYLLTGILYRDERDTFSNSVMMFDSEMKLLADYSKHHLVPFGEFIPFQKYIPLKPVAAFRGFERGKGAATFTINDIPSFSPLICYEIIFPDRVTTASGARPRWLVNVTNDGWYGNSAGPYQHFAQTRLRVIEEGLPVARAANTGISGIIDSYGRVLDSIAINKEGAIVSALPQTANSNTQLLRLMLQAALALAGLCLSVAAFFAVRRRPYP